MKGKTTLTAMYIASFVIILVTAYIGIEELGKPTYFGGLIFGILLNVVSVGLLNTQNSEPIGSTYNSG